jgi:hypothetical protein
VQLPLPPKQINKTWTKSKQQNEKEILEESNPPQKIPVVINLWMMG